MTDVTAELTRLRAIVAAQAEVIRAEREGREAENHAWGPCTDAEAERYLKAVASAEAARAALARLLAEGEAEHG